MKYSNLNRYAYFQGNLAVTLPKSDGFSCMTQLWAIQHTNKAMEQSGFERQNVIWLAFKQLLLKCLQHLKSSCIFYPAPSAISTGDILLWERCIWLQAFSTDKGKMPMHPPNHILRLYCCTNTITIITAFTKVRIFFKASNGTGLYAFESN